MPPRAAEWERHEAQLIACRACPRLVAWREQVARVRRKAYRDWEYWGKPVPGFGDRSAHLLIVGLAPGAHGSNRTGRMFTGDGSGTFLYAALHRAQFANQPTSRDARDGLSLHGAYISALCRCAPPGNKPLPEEIANCLPYLEREMALLGDVRVVVALGRLAFDQMLRLYNGREAQGRLTFAHGEYGKLGEGMPWLIASYHPSQQNTQTGRLSTRMFDRIWARARALLEETSNSAGR